MNKRILQLSLVWLLAVSVPLQGFAAMAKTCCWKLGPAVSSTVARAGADVHDKCHEEAVAPATPSHRKSPCAHCCAIGVVGAPAHSPALIVDFSTPTPVEAVPTSFISHISPGLERPPKRRDLLS